MFSQKGDPAIITESGIEKVITDCPCKSGALEVCKQFEGVFNGVCEAINPDYEFAYDLMMTKGDSSCHWVVRKKGESAKEKHKEEATLDDPVKMLTTMYIKGEITEEEFDKKMVHLKKHGLVK